ncbi:MAG: hypothetical protein Q8908_07905 [Bacteroidota bacterium]|nr:hypothetical protein [Bacteroidota bacterium]
MSMDYQFNKIPEFGRKVMELDSTEKFESEIKKRIEELKTDGATHSEIHLFISRLNMFFITFLMDKVQCNTQDYIKADRVRGILRNLLSEYHNSMA